MKFKANDLNSNAEGIYDSNSNYSNKVILAHNLQLILRGPAHLRKAQTPFDTLQVFPRSLVAEDMGLLVALVKFLASRSLVNTNHGHTDGPGTRIPLVKGQSSGMRRRGLSYAFPMLTRRYASLASTYRRCWALCTISTIGSKSPSSRSPFSNRRKSGFMFSRDWTMALNACLP